MSEVPAVTEKNAKLLRLHLGGHDVLEGWTLVNAQARPGVDVIANVVDLSMFADGSASEIYASHVYEHLGYVTELPQALREAHRVLIPGGAFRVAVPDLETLAKLFLEPQLDIRARFHVQRMIMGGQIDAYDFHKTGFNFQILGRMLHETGFEKIQRVKSFGIFKDTSVLEFLGVPISLNVQCVKKA